MDLRGARTPKRRVALIIADSLHLLANGGPANGIGGKTEQMMRSMRDRILQRLECGHRMNLIALKDTWRSKPEA